MRTKNVIRNTGFSLLLEIIVLAFGFIMPRLIILTYGSSVNGLTSAINQIIGVINLLQAGAIGASIFEMYRPVAENNYKKISIIYLSSKKYFRKLGFVFLGIIIAVIPLLVWNQSDSGIPPWAIGISVLILGLNGGYNFFFYACFDIIFSAHQRNFQMSLAGIIEKLIYYALLFLVISVKIHFVFMYVAVLIGGTAKILWLAYSFNKNYKKKLVPIEKGITYKVKNKGHLLTNQISTQVIESSPVLIISGMLGLTYASVYSVYNLIQLTLRTVFATIQYSIAASFGNVTVSENQEKVLSVFSSIHFVFSMLGTFLYTCTAFLFMPFIKLYTSNISDADYIIPKLALLIIIYSITWCLYMPFFMASNAYGLFRQTSVQSVICGAFALLISFIGVRYNMAFVLLGIIAYYLMSFIWRLIVMKRYLPWFKLKALPRRTAFIILLPLFAYCLNINMKIEAVSWTVWVILALITVFASGTLMFIYILLFERRELLLCLDYAKALLGRKK